MPLVLWHTEQKAYLKFIKYLDRVINVTAAKQLVSLKMLL